jgi:hypothetical protein
MQNDTYANTPRRWNCCHDLVTPKDLAQHYKEKHLNDGRGPTLEQYVDLIFDFLFLLSIMFIHGIKNSIWH